MEKQYKVGIVGATGMVGQRFVTLLENHPWFKLTVLAASGRSAGKTYEEAVGPRWAMTSPMPESVKKMVVLDASKVEEVASQVDFIFCAVNMPKDEIKALEEAYAKAECPVVSNNSANRFTPDVPMVVPEINADHIEIIPAQRKRLGTKRGFIAVKSNCSLQSYVPALHPLMKDFGVSKALVCTYQAISGAGKTFDRMPEIVDNVIPYIGGEEEKSDKICSLVGFFSKLTNTAAVWPSETGTRKHCAVITGFSAFTIWSPSMWPHSLSGSRSLFSSSPPMYGMMFSTISGQDLKSFPAPEIA